MTTQHDSPSPGPRAGREVSATATDEREHGQLAATTQLLHDRLGELCRPRPGFQSDLEARLVARLPEATRPWWRRSLAPAAFGSDPACRNGRAGLITRRRALAGLAAGLAGIALAGGLALPLARPTEASAAEIIEKSQEFAANPLLSGIRSFHLKARTTGRPFQPGKAVTSTTEQWFVAPDKMRMESRTEVDGKTSIGGSVHVDGELVAYATPGADRHDLVGVMPIALPATRVDGPPAEGARVNVSIVRKKDDGGPPPDGASVGVIIRRPGPDGPPTDEDVRVIRRAGPDGATPAEGASDVIVVDNCPPPTRKGEGTVANRKVHIVEMDHSACLPADAPAELRGRVVTWADRETYLPLKIEHYGVDGKRVHSYEVTSVEYDVAIPGSVFKDVPPSGTVRIQLPKPPFGTQAAPAPPPGGAFEKPAAPPAPRR